MAEPLINREGQYEFAFMNVVPIADAFRVLTPAPSMEVLGEIAYLSELAVTGELRCLVYAGVTITDEVVYADVGEDIRPVTLIGAVEVLKETLIKRLHEIQSNPKDGGPE